MNALRVVPFAFEDKTVRVAANDGQPWFVAADICAALGIKNVTQATAPLDSDERSMFNIGRAGDAIVVNEAAVYTLALRCRNAMKPGTAPYRLRKWVTGELLPSIRRSAGSGEVTVSDFDVGARKVIGGVTRSIVHKELREALVELLPTLVASAVNDRIANERLSIVQGVSALEILERCGINKGQRPKNSSQFVSRRLMRYHIARGVPVKLAKAGSSSVYLFDEIISREWLNAGGSAEIRQYVAERAGQGRLRLSVIA